MYDILIKNGLITDGKRTAPFRADLAIKDGKIASIGNPEGEALRVLDAEGFAVAPGFINIHSHSDAAPLVNYPVESSVAMGITTEVTGNCGTSNIPCMPNAKEILTEYFDGELQLPRYDTDVICRDVDDYAKRIEAAASPGNYAALIGHGTLRLNVMGFVSRIPTPQELEQMKQLLDEQLSRGAFGMSLGLIYPPSSYSEKEELIELAKVVRKHDGILSVHMRNENAGVFDSVKEMIYIAEQSGVHLEISHLKLMGKPQWGKADELLALIDDARARGVNINADQYPYLASSTSLTVLIPSQDHEGGTAAMLERLTDPDDKLLNGMSGILESRGGANTVMVTTTHGKASEFEGKYLDEIAQTMGTDPLRAAIELIIRCEGKVSAVFFCMDKGDMLKIMSRMDLCVGSDGYALSYDPEYTPNNPHPRSFGTFVEFLALVRENKLMSLEDAVFKCTGLPAQILGIKDRGVLEEGKAADICIFDPGTVASAASYTDSKQKPIGLPYVIAEGRLIWENGCLTGEGAGRLLRHE